ncbi:hypothetical protein BC628DRAFT_1401273 [Trametes gibbosa]|nr:hypothetical protein BC628DRAFT_1401273 [Trametes gibbosa]
MLALNLVALGLSAISAVAAFPAVKLPRAAPGPWCNGLGVGAFDEATNVTLAAWNSTGTNTNSTGAPLVLATGGSITGIEFRRMATWASFPFNDFPTVSLVNGTLIPNGEHTTPAQATIVEEGSQIGFVLRNSANPLQGAQIYCGVADVDPAGHGTGHPFLAVNGDTDSFQLCKVGSQNVVFWKPIPDHGEDFASCYPIKVQIIEQN